MCGYKTTSLATRPLDGRFAKRQVTRPNAISANCRLMLATDESSLVTRRQFLQMKVVSSGLRVSPTIPCHAVVGSGKRHHRTITETTLVGYRRTSVWIHAMGKTRRRRRKKMKIKGTNIKYADRRSYWTSRTQWRSESGTHEKNEPSSAET